MQKDYNYGFDFSPIEAGWIMDLDQYLEKMDTTTTFILIQLHYTSNVSQNITKYHKLFQNGARTQRFQKYQQGGEICVMCHEIQVGENLSLLKYICPAIT